MAQPAPRAIAAGVIRYPRWLTPHPLAALGASSSRLQEGEGTRGRNVRQNWVSGIAVGVLLAMPLLAGCARPDRGAPGAALRTVLYVANALDGTLTRLDGATGATLGPPLPGGPAPYQVAPGADGNVLVLSQPGTPGVPGAPNDPAQAGALTYVARSGSRWTARPVPLEPGARATLLAGDGGSYAVVAYKLPPEPGGASAATSRCRLALVDLRTGVVERTHPLCTARDLVTGLALEHRATGPVASVALWRRSADVDGRREPASAQIMAVDARTGALVGAATLDGLPRPPAAGGSLLLATGSPGPVLYCVEAVPGSTWDTWGEQEYTWMYSLSRQWRLLALEASTLEPLREYALPFAPFSLGVAPDRRHAYAFDGPGVERRASIAAGSDLMEIDLATGVAGRLAGVPGLGGAGLVVTDERIYVPDPERNAVSMVDRRSGRLIKSLPAGAWPRGIVAG